MRYHRTIGVPLVMIVGLALACFGHSTAQDAGTGNKKPPVPASADEIEKLIKQLGSKNPQIRERATKALQKVGAPALPFLKAAMKSTDLEVTRRAQLLHADIQAALRELRMASLLKEYTALGLDHFVDRMGRKAKQMNDEDWEVISLFAKEAGRDKSALATKISLHEDILTFRIVHESALFEKSHLAQRRVLAKTISAKSHVADCLIVAAKSVKSDFQLANSVVFCNGDLDCLGVGNSIVICDGNIKIGTHVVNSILICHGKIEIGAHIVDSCVIAKGTVLKKSFVENSVVNENQVKTIGQFGFFETGLLGIEVVATANGVRVSRVVKDRQLTNSGIRVDDLIVAVGSAEIRDITDFRELLRLASMEKEVTLTVQRGDNNYKIKLQFDN